MKKIASFLLFQFAILMIASSQDIIIKKDKTEIKSKVVEITEEKIKYHKWEMKDGPLYNISKSDVFMIIYQNGQRETISANQAPKPVQKTQEPNKVTVTPGRPAAGPADLDTSISRENAKIKYSPSRLTANISTPFTLTLDGETRLIKNLVNMGLSSTYMFIKDAPYIFYGYLSVYLPVNRVSKNYEKQDLGLFVFGHAGVSVVSGTIQVAVVSSYGTITYKTQSYTNTGFGWYLGADYFFSKKFGLSVKTSEFKSFALGVAISFAKK
jgi:hypothetical protein